ncbi:MAG: hypothetical protein IPI60_09445 [Saprospiraceae bacterium]|nr:hypothetical protein [Saprospiraceae bacterium]
MKQLLILLLLVSASVGSYAQKISEGVIKMELTDVKSDDPSVASQMAMMKGSTNDIYFSKDQQKVSMSMMGGMMNMMVFTTPATKETKLFMDMMGNKFQVKTPMEEPGKAEDEMDIKMTDETKEIKGYKCKKVIMTPKKSATNGQDMTITVYVTDRIDMTGPFTPQMKGATKLKGAPLEMSIQTGGVSMVYTCKSVETSLPKDSFKEPKGYKEMSKEEYEKMMSGFGM